MSKSYYYAFSDILKLLFKKKICKHCNGKLKKVVHCTFIKRGWKRTGFFSWEYGEFYDSTFAFECQSCQKSYTLDEL